MLSMLIEQYTGMKREKKKKMLVEYEKKAKNSYFNNYLLAFYF